MAIELLVNQGKPSTKTTSDVLGVPDWKIITKKRIFRHRLLIVDIHLPLVVHGLEAPPRTSSHTVHCSKVALWIFFTVYSDHATVSPVSHASSAPIVPKVTETRSGKVNPHTRFGIYIARWNEINLLDNAFLCGSSTTTTNSTMLVCLK